MQIFFSQIFSTIQQEKFFLRKKKKEKLFVQRLVTKFYHCANKIFFRNEKNYFDQKNIEKNF